MRIRKGLLLIVLPVVCSGLTSCANQEGQAAPEASPAVRVPATDPTGTPTPTAKHTVVETGSRIRPFSLPTFKEFARDASFSDVVVGTIKATKVIVGEAGDVQTRVSIQVEEARSATPGTTIAAREPGGVVRLSEVAETFRGHVSDTDLQRRSDELVDYQAEGFPHSKVGQRVLAVLGGSESSAGGPFIAALLIDQGAGNFGWAAAPPNPRWSRSYPPSDVATFVLAR